jgi:hypothetical protein
VRESAEAGWRRPIFQGLRRFLPTADDGRGPTKQGGWRSEVAQTCFPRSAARPTSHRSAADLQNSSALRLLREECFLKTFDPLKMPAIVCKQRQVMSQCRSGNKQIKIADKFSGAAQGASADLFFKVCGF